MKAFIIGLFLIFVGTIVTFAQQNVKYSLKQEKIINLSKQKWQWMAEKNVDLLEKLFDDKSMFIHMGGTWGKSEELTTIESENIWYKKVVVYETELLNPKVEEKYDAVCFFSPSGVRSFAKFNSLDGMKLFSIGETTEKELKKFTKNKIITSKESNLDDLLKLIKAESEKHNAES